MNASFPYPHLLPETHPPSAGCSNNCKRVVVLAQETNGSASTQATPVDRRALHHGPVGPAGPIPGLLVCVVPLGDRDSKTSRSPPALVLILPTLHRVPCQPFPCRREVDVYRLQPLEGRRSV